MPKFRTLINPSFPATTFHFKTVSLHPLIAATTHVSMTDAQVVDHIETGVRNGGRDGFEVEFWFGGGAGEEVI
jgi:hypothetical protein